MAIEDAVILARAFKKHREPADAFAAFAAERFSRTSRIAGESYDIGRVGQWENLTACWIRNQVMRAVMPYLAPKMFSKHAAFDPGTI